MILNLSQYNRSEHQFLATLIQPKYMMGDRLHQIIALLDSCSTRWYSIVVENSRYSGGLIVNVKEYVFFLASEGKKNMLMPLVSSTFSLLLPRSDYLIFPSLSQSDGIIDQERYAQSGYT